MTKLPNEAMEDPGVRRVFEEEVVVNEAIDTLVARVESLELTQKGLSERLGVIESRVS